MVRYRHGLVAVLVFWGLAESAQAQWYHARLVTEEGDPIPFFLRLPEDCTTESATIVNGPEFLPTECERSDTGFALEFPVYDTRIDARFVSDGSARGEWVMVLPGVGEHTMRFEARPVSEPDPRARFVMESEEADPSPVDVSGTWRFDFNDYGVGKGVFEQTSSQVVTGTIELPSEYGDMRFLAGNVRGTHMYLSTFDGRHAFFLEGRVHPDGTMEGEWVHSFGWDPFVAERDESYRLPDPLDRVQLIESAARLDLEPLRSGHYAGKAVIVEIFGTWCPNCNDLAPVLADLHRKYRADGLEILGLAFEYEDSPAESERRVRAFEQKHGAEWDIVIPKNSFEDLVNEGLGGLTAIEGVPVTIFLNRDGTVHAVYTGFSGPATGDAHLEAKARFETLTIEILRSK